MADWKGLEPSTFRVTGGRSNQLNYQSERGKSTSALRSVVFPSEDA